MSFFPDTWATVLTTPQHLITFCVVVSLVGVTVLLSLPGGWLQRLGSAGAAMVSAAVLGPFLVSPTYLSGGLWTWGLALLGATAIVATCITHAVRAALGCVLTSKIEWSSWLVGLIATWLALILSGAHVWAIGLAITFVGAYLMATFLPAHVSSTTRSDELVKAAALISLPTILTGVPWAGVPALLVALVAAVLSSRTGNSEKRIRITRTSVVSVHALSGLMPFALLIFGAPALAAHL